MQNQHVLFVGEPQYPVTLHPRIILPPPDKEPIHDVFAEAMLETNSVHERRNPLEWIASVGVHVAILGMLLMLPLYFTSGLDIQRFNLTFLSPPVTPPAAPPADPLISSSVSHAVRPMTNRAYVAGKLTAPSFVPRAIVTTPGEGSLSEESALGVPGGMAGGIPGGQLGGVAGGILGGMAKEAPAPAAPMAEGPKKPVLVGGDVKPPRLIYGPDPDYPVLAKQARISGVVLIEAIIDEHGNVTSMHAVSGQPLLIPAALKAVSKRKYEPTVLDGEATPIDLRVEISFHVS